MQISSADLFTAAGGSRVLLDDVSDGRKPVVVQGHQLSEPARGRQLPGFRPVQQNVWQVAQRCLH